MLTPGRRSQYACSAFAVALGVVLSGGCNEPVVASASDMVQRWEKEERQVETTCAELDDASPQASRADADPLLVEASRRASLDEARVQFGTVLKSLGASCDVDGVLQGAAPAVAACEANLKQAFDAASKGEDPARRKLAAVYKSADIDDKTLTQMPVKVLRRLDLSAAVVRGIVVLGDESATVVDDLASVAGNFKGVARTLASRVASELVAYALDVALDTMEKSSLATRAAISRRACRVYGQAQSRPALTATLLRRAILRSSTTDLTRPGANAYAGIDACNALDKLDDEACRRIAAAADTRNRHGFAPEQLSPTSKTQALAARVKSGSESPMALIGSGLGGSVDTAASKLADAYTRATRVCSSEADCSLEKLNLAVSVANTYSLEPSKEQWSALLTTLEGWERAGVDVESLRDNVREVRGAVQHMFELSREREIEDRLMMKALLELVRSLGSCKAALEKAVQRREQVANALLGRSAIDCKQRPRGVEERVLASTPDRAIVIRLDAAEVCDLAHPLQIDVSADAIFDPCSPVYKGQRNEGAVDKAVATLGDAFKASGVDDIVVLGHSDRNVVSAQSESCKKHGIVDNWVLSDRRAQTLAEGLAPRLPGVKLTPVGRGPSEPLCTEATDACLARNRRVSFRLRAPQLSLDLSCAAK